MKFTTLMSEPSPRFWRTKQERSFLLHIITLNEQQSSLASRHHTFLSLMSRTSLRFWRKKQGRSFKLHVVTLNKLHSSLASRHPPSLCPGRQCGSGEQQKRAFLHHVMSFSCMVAAANSWSSPPPPTQPRISFASYLNNEEIKIRV